MAETAHTHPREAGGQRRNSKSAGAFRTISEVADELDVPQHVLRFWESKFSQVKPLKRGGGRRYYRPEDIELLRRIRTLLYREGYTIKGVQKLLRESQSVRSTPPAAGGNGTVGADAVATRDGGRGALTAGQRREIEAIISELNELKKLLKG